jgi:hypothetical protein
VLVTRGDEEVGIGDQHRCNVIRFVESLEQGALEAALGPYRGDLAPGVLVSGLPEFERWLEAARTRLRERGFEAAMRLAGREEGADRLG